MMIPMAEYRRNEEIRWAASPAAKEIQVLEIVDLGNCVIVGI